MYYYAVQIKGLETIPLRTTREGAVSLINSFDMAGATAPEIVEQVDRGTGFKNSFIGVTRIVEDEVPLPNFQASLAKVKAKFFKAGAVKMPAMKKAVKKAVKKVAPKKAVKKAVKKKA